MDEKIAQKAAVPMVLVEVFYEVLCPDSKDFIMDQVRTESLDCIFWGLRCLFCRFILLCRKLEEL